MFMVRRLCAPAAFWFCDIRLYIDVYLGVPLSEMSLIPALLSWCSFGRSPYTILVLVHVLTLLLIRIADPGLYILTTYL